MAKKYAGNLITQLAKALVSSQGDPRIAAAKSSGIKPIISKDKSFLGYDWGNQDPTTAQMKGVEDLATRIEDLQDIDGGVSIPQLGGLALTSAKLHPFKTMGLAGLGAGNIGGLTDNDKFGGQLGGLALGGLGSYLMGANPYAAAMMTMGGGQLGALFDKLRARREQEQSYGGR